MSGPRLSVIPAGALADVIAGLLKDSDLRILNAIGSFTDRNGWTFPTRQEVLGERCGFGRQRVSEAVIKLEWLGWVETSETRPDKPMAYRVLLDPTGERQPGEAPALSLAKFKALRRGQTVSEDDAPLSSNDDNPLSSNDDKPCRHCGDNPCRHCDDNNNDESSDDSLKTRARVQTPDSGPGHGEAGPVGQAGGSGEAGQGASLSAQAMAGIAGQRHPQGQPGTANGAAPSQDAHEGAGGKGRASAAKASDGLDPAAFRSFVREKLGPDIARDRFNRLTIREGCLVAPNEFCADELWRDFWPVLAEAGVSVIRSESNQRDVYP